jgi:RNA polymerase sigma factor (sigma-70 family)
MEFAAFYKEAKDDCLRTVTAVVGNCELAEDLVAEAFSKAWASWAKVVNHPVPRAWIVRTALNARVSWWRRFRHELFVGDWLEGQQPSYEDTFDRFPDDQIMTAIRALPQRQCEVLALRIFLDLDTETTARSLGIAPGTVTAHLARATRALRDCLASNLEQEPLP